MAESLTIIENHYTYRIVWIIDGDEGATLGEAWRGKHSQAQIDGPNNRKDGTSDHYIAENVAHDSEGVERDSRGFYWDYEAGVATDDGEIRPAGRRAWEKLTPEDKRAAQQAAERKGPPQTTGDLAPPPTWESWGKWGLRERPPWAIEESWPSPWGLWPDDRDYTLFGFLAGVRRFGEDGAIMAPPRGMPEDAAPKTRKEYDSWGG